MNIKFKLGSNKFEVSFKVIPTNSNGITLIAKDSKNLDILHNAIADANAPVHLINSVLQKSIEQKLKLPIEVDSNYNGAGYGFKFDMHSIVKMLK
tara:strand:+ start:52 stop:336 length:285 start_codon:yes stop_codon:yes gene_type:complete